MKAKLVISLLMVAVVLATIVPGCTPALAADGYTAVVPAVIQSGTKQAVAVSLFAGQSPASGEVTVALLKGGKEVTKTSTNINSNGTVQLNVPPVAEGEYTISVHGDAVK